MSTVHQRIPRDYQYLRFQLAPNGVLWSIQVQTSRSDGWENCTVTVPVADLRTDEQRVNALERFCNEELDRELVVFGQPGKKGYWAMNVARVAA